MRKTFAIIICVLAVISITAFASGNLRKGSPKPLVQKPINNTGITSSMMNGKPAFFTTYEDFLNGTGKAWTFDGEQVYGGNGKIVFTDKLGISKYEFAFKDEKGKRVKVLPTDFWGWRGENGLIYRNGDFIHEGITKIAFKMLYIANDFIYYVPRDVASFKVAPTQWCSEGINSPIIALDNFSADHNTESFKRIRKLDADCGDEAYSRPIPVQAYLAPSTTVANCLLQSKDMVCIWAGTSTKAIPIKKFENYFFKQDNFSTKNKANGGH